MRYVSDDAPSFTTTQRHTDMDTDTRIECTNWDEAVPVKESWFECD